MILAQLKEATRHHHDRMERDPLSRGLMSHPDLGYYVRMLGVYYGFYTPIEARLLRAAAWPSVEFAIERRLKTPLLERDLAYFGLEGELTRVLPTCPELPALRDLPDAIGCLYVLEGATLGGQLIARHLGAALGLGPESGVAFFNSYGPEVGPMWKEFRAFAETYAPGHEQAIIASAVATFAAMEQWFAICYAGLSVVALDMPRRKVTI